ncbi:hypothetical protein PHMEG_0008422 [Phytophthora megakarya]|uniref:Uncharacterized protein n=1 Tax=Phytophthora megakarya TaxID=4795 RepID=A0A225WJ77_9STRA|nr:hypothetical protein PHMEG_0008422 [Phytophthora megakarya]
MNAPSSWKVSHLWSAKGDERCAPPQSDDYKDWSLTQLKREITQRQLKTNPRRRNKDAFVRVLLSNDQEQTQETEAQSRPSLEDPVIFVPTSTSELQHIYVNNGDQQQQNQDLYGDNEGQPLQSSLYNRDQQQKVSTEPQQQQESFVNTGEQQSFVTNEVKAGAMQTAPSTPPVQAPTQEQTETPRQKVGEAAQESEGNEKTTSCNSSSTEVSRLVGKESTEYLRQKLSIQAARLEIESRRLDLETKREQRNNELHAVQLALAREQLQQAKLTTQKMKTEWMVEQMLQKKRLSDASISHEDSTALGMYLS